MDWTFAITQIVVMITAIVSAIITGIITVRYQKLDSLGVSQRIRDKFTAVILAILSFLAVAIPLGGLITVAYQIYFFVLKSPNAPVTRAGALLISLYVVGFVVFLAQSAYNFRRVHRGYKQEQQAKREREFRARRDAELKPLDDALKKLKERLDRSRIEEPEKETESLPPKDKPVDPRSI